MKVCTTRCQNARFRPPPCSCKGCGGTAHAQRSLSLDDLAALIDRKLLTEDLHPRELRAWVTVLDTIDQVRRLKLRRRAA